MTTEALHLPTPASAAAVRAALPEGRRVAFDKAMKAVLKRHNGPGGAQFAEIYDELAAVVRRFAMLAAALVMADRTAVDDTVRRLRAGEPVTTIGLDQFKTAR